MALDPTEVPADVPALAIEEPADAGADMPALAGTNADANAGTNAGVPAQATWWRRVWTRLNTPTERVPADYRDGRLAGIVNRAMDREATGPAHDAEVGEAVSLAVDHASNAEPGAPRTPMQHLRGALADYTWRVWDTAPKR